MPTEVRSFYVYERGGRLCLQGTLFDQEVAASVSIYGTNITLPLGSGRNLVVGVLAPGDKHGGDYAILSMTIVEDGRK